MPDTQLDIEDLANEIARESPEGRPAFPRLGARDIWMLLGGAALFLLVGGVLVAVFIDRQVGVTATVLSLALFLVYPIFWASILRARERQRIRRSHSGGE
jgi:uncharacterized membrane protein